MKELLPMILREEEGQGMVEYGLIIAGVALAAMAAIWLLGPQISDLFTQITTQLSA
ncbi:Flp family type IVb pilin [Eubacteriaceae bacterium ES3]|nr:Flp family type IVb pilin [Eubacteriaceae bacterium ES3]